MHFIYLDGQLFDLADFLQIHHQLFADEATSTLGIPTALQFRTESSRSGNHFSVVVEILFSHKSCFGAY